MKEHFDDEYVLRAQQEGYRSRAVYKLNEIDEKAKLIKPNMRVVDLGAAPGGWTQYVAEKVGKSGAVVASDILDMQPIPGVEVVIGDFREEVVLDAIIAALDNNQPDLVISDMAPNFSGMAADQPRSMYLVELALDLARNTLKPGGAFLCKVFQGAGSEEYFRDLKSSFKVVQIKKPKASRARSREVYVLALGFKG
jgi:23S rRNA (uridine2552-2'-O)-methyltransferase